MYALGTQPPQAHAPTRTSPSCNSFTLTQCTTPPLTFTHSPSFSFTGSKAELASKVAALEEQAQQSAAELTQAKSQAAHAESEAASAKTDLTATVERLEARCADLII